MTAAVRMGTSVAMPNRGADVVRLFEYEPDLLARLPAQEADTARHYTVVECVTLPRGEKEVARWPGVLSAVLDRVDNRFMSLSLQLALAKLPRLDARLLCLFWHLADRWGKVERDGIVVEMALSHQTLADLVSARRPSVSRALAELRESGLLTRLAHGRWLLRGESPAQRPRA